MSVKPIVVVSADAELVNRIVRGLESQGLPIAITDSVPSTDLAPTLCIIHFAGALAASGQALLHRIVGDCRVIAIVPRAQLATITELMGLSSRISTVLVEESCTEPEIEAAATRTLTGDAFGLGKQLRYGVTIERIDIASVLDKDACLGRVLEYAERVGVPRHLHASIEQCLDEMVMNALYSAPVDSAGNHIFSGIHPRMRVTLAVDQVVVVEYGFDGERFGISVRDTFGSLDRRTVLAFLHKCFVSAAPVDRKEGGAGVGLYLMLNAASVVAFTIVPSVATEVLCTFATEREPAMVELDLLVLSNDVSGRIANDPPHRPPGQPRSLVPVAPPPVAREGFAKPAAIGLIIATLAVGAIAIVRKHHATSDEPGASAPRARLEVTSVPPGAAIDLDGKGIGLANGRAIEDLEVGRPFTLVAKFGGYAPTTTVVQPHAGDNAVVIRLEPLPAMLEVESEPSGASVFLDDKAMGETPTSFAVPPDKTVHLVFKTRGYDDRAIDVATPHGAEKRPVSATLVMSDRYVQVRFVSNPSGARLVALPEQANDSSKTFTPTELMLEVGKPQSFMLVMPDYKPLVIAPFTPKKGAALEKGGALQPK